MVITYVRKILPCINSTQNISKYIEVSFLLMGPAAALISIPNSMEIAMYI